MLSFHLYPYIDTSVLTSLSHTLISLFLPDKHYDLGYIMFSICLCVYVMEMLCEMLVLFSPFFFMLVLICRNIIKWGIVLWILAQMCGDVLLVSDSSVMSHGGPPWPSGKQEEWSKGKALFFQKHIYRLSLLIFLSPSHWYYWSSSWAVYSVKRGPFFCLNEKCCVMHNVCCGCLVYLKMILVILEDWSQTQS